MLMKRGGSLDPESTGHRTKNIFVRFLSVKEEHPRELRFDCGDIVIVMASWLDDL